MAYLVTFFTIGNFTVILFSRLPRTTLGVPVNFHFWNHSSSSKRVVCANLACLHTHTVVRQMRRKAASQHMWGGMRFTPVFSSTRGGCSPRFHCRLVSFSVPQRTAIEFLLRRIQFQKSSRLITSNRHVVFSPPPFPVHTSIRFRPK